MSKEDLKEEELMLLKAIFRVADEMMDSLGPCIWNMDRNTLYDLKQKLGIQDLVG